MARYNESYVQRMRARATRAKVQADLTGIKAKLATETDPVRRAKLKADAAEARFTLASNRVRRRSNGGGE